MSFVVACSIKMSVYVEHDRGDVLCGLDVKIYWRGQSGGCKYYGWREGYYDRVCSFIFVKQST